jgi:hypothetical protein
MREPQSTWVEDYAQGQFIPARFFEDTLSLDSKDDLKLLNDIDWSKIGFAKKALTKMNGH